jgi:phosphoribosylanthranilate isomerase
MSQRTRIKICGITNLEDARAAIDYGADALGFIFVKSSPRYVRNFPGALDVVRDLPPFVTPVGVCLDGAELPSLQELSIGTIQYYMHEMMDGPLLEKMRVIRAFPVKDESSSDAIEQAMIGPNLLALLLDAYHPSKLGGSGETFNWDLAVEAKARFGKPIILAGGLTPENVGDAVAAVRPYAVDVSSGVEAEPGWKDHVKLKAFINAVRQADSK